MQKDFIADMETLYQNQKLEKRVEVLEQQVQYLKNTVSAMLLTEQNTLTALNRLSDAVLKETEFLNKVFG